MNRDEIRSSRSIETCIIKVKKVKAVKVKMASSFAL